jgi:serine/threonine-protein kinase
LDLTDPDHPKPGNAEAFPRETYGAVDPAFSPDGHWITYVATSRNPGTRGVQIFVRPFPSAPSDGKWLIASGAVKFPTWSRTSRELFYLDGEMIMSVRYSATEHSFNPEKPRAWAPTRIFRPGNNALWDFDPAPDGRRFVVLAQPEPRSAENVHVTVLLNFFDELRRKVPLRGN